MVFLSAAAVVVIILVNGAYSSGLYLWAARCSAGFLDVSSTYNGRRVPHVAAWLYVHAVANVIWAKSLLKCYLHVC